MGLKGRTALVLVIAIVTPPAARTVTMVNLLEDRFQLAMHLETREQPIFQVREAGVRPGDTWTAKSNPRPRSNC